MATLWHSAPHDAAQTRTGRDPAVPAIAVGASLVVFLLVAASASSLGLAAIAAMCALGAVGMIAAIL